MALQLPGIVNPLFDTSKARDQGISPAGDPVITTKEIFIYGLDPAPTIGPYAYYLTFEIGPDGGTGNVTFRCPHDYSVVENAELLYFADITHASTDIDINISFSKVGQDADGRDETNTSGTYSSTIKKLATIDITSMLENMDPGDMVGIQIVNNDQAVAGMTMKFLGLRLRYV